MIIEEWQRKITEIVPNLKNGILLESAFPIIYAYIVELQSKIKELEARK